MKVECIRLRRDQVQGSNESGGDYGMKVGRWYTVYGTYTTEEIVYYLLDKGHLATPVFAPSFLFGKPRGAFPPGVETLSSDGFDGSEPVVSFKAFTDFWEFFGRLSEGDEAAVAAWRKFRAYANFFENISDCEGL